MVLFTHLAGRRASVLSRADSHWRRRCSSKPLHLLSRSLVTIHLCCFWTRQTFEKEKHHSLPSVRLIHSPSVCVDFPCTLPHTANIMQMKHVKARPPGWTMHGQRKISPVCINEAQCPAQVSPPLHRQAWGWLWGSASCSAHSGSPQGNLHQDDQFCRCKGSKREKPKHFPPVDLAVRENLVRDFREVQQGSLDSST